MRQQTWFATLVCVVGVIPGFIIGGLMKALMYVVGGWAEGSDFLYLRRLFGIEMPGLVYEFIFAHALPSFVQAFIAAIVATWIMDKVARGANYGLAATITGALYSGFLICLIILSLPTTGVTRDLLLSIVQTVGLWVGLGAAASTLPVSRPTPV